MTQRRRIRLGANTPLAAVFAATLGAAVGAASLARADLRILDGGPGADLLEVGDHAAHVVAADGDDHARGSPEPDLLDGNAGNDTLVGGGGPDTLNGGRGSDSVSGGAGEDLMAGNRGEDTLNGGPGADRFVLAATGARDVLPDFSPAEGDRIQVAGSESAQVEAAPSGVMVRLADGSAFLIPGATAAEVAAAVDQATPPGPPAAAAPSS
jgi:Ca2+-binding RTX toxin-like protein